MNRTGTHTAFAACAQARKPQKCGMHAACIEGDKLKGHTAVRTGVDTGAASDALLRIEKDVLHYEFSCL